MRILVDTNIAVRLYDQEDRKYREIQFLLGELPPEDELFFCPQVIFELRVVLTRPKADNGYGLTASDFQYAYEKLRKSSTFHRDPDDLLDRWLRICDRYGIVGKQSHDARLVAWMEAYAIDAILTLNPRHFAPFPGIRVLTP